MIKNLCLIVLSAATLTSCVSAKVYKDLEARYADLKSDNQELSHDLTQSERLRKQFEEQAQELENELATTRAERDALERDYAATKANLENLQNSYDALEANSSKRIAENSQKNRELIAELDEKQAALAAEQTRLEKLQRDLTDRSRRVEELESMIAAKDAKMRQLKDAISKALVDFEGNGLTVEQRDGKVYVSLENKLLFDSGSWTVGANGRKAVNQLGSVLAQNPEIAVLIEGHTDNVPYGGNGPIKDNWDLSTKRATAIVEILSQNSSIDPKNLTAAGRGEYAPVATNQTAEGKAKNRRIEVILTPKLDEVTKLLNDI
ncbi:MULTISPECIES: OmpA family protein [unclassified Leeuwenhoekiella]|uniref:OmpA/MotB family protein n=1 Tax=unclassified Leeuwenhoekiella TaxID=2615029 RepID=UPI000C3C277F|nr:MULTISPECIES: OmpA family protein [unclassified Leeuwenhoekiella]MAW96108.1 cell envelope biogenesis protein OmpA [Leeuwenhoekiella sp.]MBA80102.1 cell envelope biogenesis protein OmpA [Leeuwenhoekiella sp.]|tara:strand:+ start:13908 stop:14867 length:960 start_codon:yes stop_codon:yes gene_type:complete